MASGRTCVSRHFNVDATSTGLLCILSAVNRNPESHVLYSMEGWLVRVNISGRQILVLEPFAGQADWRICRFNVNSVPGFRCMKGQF